VPSTHADFWLKKFKANADRDLRVESELRALGWCVLVVWSCETRNLNDLTPKLTDFLDRSLREKSAQC
jgi:DNA mismatch endonuclease (patch repair protein)